jgi:hypothetical protein
MIILIDDALHQLQAGGLISGDILNREPGN